MIASERYELFSVFAPLYALFVLPAGLLAGGETRGYLRAAGTLAFGVLATVYAIGHLGYLNVDLDTVLAAEVIATARAEVHDACVARYVNGRVDCERGAGRGAQVNPGQLAVEAPDQLDRHPERYYHGKLVLAAARRGFRERFPGKQLRTHHTSAYLETADLVTVGRNAFGQAELGV